MSKLKRIASRVPGVIVAYGLLKNGRHAVQASLPTRGGISRYGMDPDAAAAYVVDIFAKVDRFLTVHGGWHGKRVLEVGPGDSLGTGLLALAHGAESYQALDAFRVHFDPAVEAAVFARLRDSLSPDAVSRVADLEPRGTPVDGSDRFAYTNDLPLERAVERLGRDRYHVIFSNAVLEHVADPRRAAAALGALLAPGGVMLHDIDLRSHQTYEAHPLQFLEHPSWLWRMMSSHAGEPNRARLGDWLDHFRAAGVEILAAETVEQFSPELIERVRPRLAAVYRSLSLEALSPAVILITARKPATEIRADQSAGTVRQ